LGLIEEHVVPWLVIVLYKAMEDVLVCNKYLIIVGTSIYNKCNQTFKQYCNDSWEEVGQSLT